MEMCVPFIKATMCNFQKIIYGDASNEAINLSPFTFSHYLASNYMFKVNNRKTRTRSEICAKLKLDFHLPKKIIVLFASLKAL